MTGTGTSSVDRLVDRPAAFAGVLDVAARCRSSFEPSLLERRVQRARGATSGRRSRSARCRRSRRRSRSYSRLLQQLEALGVRLHQAVLDAVVDHLHEVAGAGRADVRVAVLRRERLEDRLERARPAPSSPPAIRQKPTSRPQMPPETPQSTKRMPFAAARRRAGAASRGSSSCRRRRSCRPRSSEPEQLLERRPR